ncbi:MAG: acetyltransferase, partial [Bacteroidota bacterium]|nr:acetyltransferase [Bacteroidota bacterium]
VVVFGVSDFASQVSFYLKQDSDFEIVAYTVDAEYNHAKTFLGLPVVDFETVQASYPPTDYAMFIAIGYHKLNSTRTNKFNQAKEKGYQLISYICSRNSYWNDLTVGENCFIMEGNLFMQNVRIADNVIMAVGNKIGHDSVIEENCFLTSNVMMGGFCTIKKNTFIGLSVVIKDKTTIGENNILGAGAILLKNTKNESSFLTKSTPLTPDPNNFIQDFI